MINSGKLRPVRRVRVYTEQGERGGCDSVRNEYERLAVGNRRDDEGAVTLGRGKCKIGS